MSADRSVAEQLGPPLVALLGDPLPVRFELWDGSTLGPLGARGTLVLHGPDVLRRLIWSPGELGLARAFVSGDIDLHGDIVEAMQALGVAGDGDVRTWVRAAPGLLRAAARLGALGRPLPPPPEELLRPRGRRHSLRRDAQVISHHYDVGNDFYRLVLGESMTYSCARFADPAYSLEEAQASKHELICRKLGLAEQPGMRLLDVGCGWGSLAIHAAREHGAHVVGVTISHEQAELARRRVVAAGLDGNVEIRLADYREVRGETFDAVSSVGMFEHVGTARTAEYFGILRSLVRSEGRLLNHAISSVGGSVMEGRQFINRYVFPDGELLDVGESVLAMERAGFEVRDVESLREHYAATLRRWIANLERNWDEAVALVGEGRARVWRLYMAGSVVGFTDGGINVHQVLGVVPSASGASGMPTSRDGWTTTPHAELIGAGAR